jgi:hypothetical protein
MERLQVRRQFLILKLINCHHKGMVFVAMSPSVLWTSAWPLLIFVGQVPGCGPGITKLMLPRHLSWGGAMATNNVFHGGRSNCSAVCSLFKTIFFTIHIWFYVPVRVCACLCVFVCSITS